MVSPPTATSPSYETEIIEFLKAGYLGTLTVRVSSRDGNWIEPTLRYTARDLAGAAANDDDPGRIRPGANIDGANFYNYLTYSPAWYALTATEKRLSRSACPSTANGAPEPGVNGYLSPDRIYSAGGRALNRASVRSWRMSGKPTLDELFERRITYPDFERAGAPCPPGRARRSQVPADQDPGLLVNPAGLKRGRASTIPAPTRLLNTVLRRPPLVVLAGDVGSGKSELAETIGDAVARQERHRHHAVSAEPFDPRARAASAR